MSPSVLIDKRRVGYDVSSSLVSGMSLPDQMKRDMVIFDDVLSTGTTVAKLASWLKGNGAMTVTLACTHVIDTTHDEKEYKRQVIGGLRFENFYNRLDKE
jgi:phosphoribosylpyrophosphate synthetase